MEITGEPLLRTRIEIPSELRLKEEVEGRILDFGGDIRIGDLRNAGTADFLVYRSIEGAHDGGMLWDMETGSFARFAHVYVNFLDGRVPWLRIETRPLMRYCELAEKRSLNMLNAEDILKVKGEEVLSVTADATIRDALALMVERKVGSTLVAEGDRFVGIWTERDLMRNSLETDFDPRTARIGDYMVTGLRFAPHTDTVYDLMDKFLGLRLRHLLVKKGEEYIGLLSVGDVVKSCLREKTREFEELHAVVSWEYYEEWGYPGR